MEQQVWKSGARRSGAALALAGIAVMILAVVASPNAGATPPNNTFQGTCVGTMTAGTCTLDEPEGKNPATNGTVTYARVLDSMSFVISPDHSIQEVQICMQESGPFAAGANVCAGSHGHHVAYSYAANVYTVNLASQGFASSDPLYWTLHVVAGGATLQVLSPDHASPPPTTTTTHHATTSTTHHSTTTTHHSTTTTTHHSTTTTTGPTPSTTTTTIADGSTTTTTDPSTTTTSTTFPAVTSTTAPPLETTTTTLPTNVLGKTLSRTGGIQWWVLVSGAFLLLLGVSLLLSTRIVQGAKPAG